MPVVGFKWRKNLFRFDEEFIQDYNKDSDKRGTLEVDVNYSVEKRLKNLLKTCFAKKTMSYRQEFWTRH